MNTAQLLEKATKGIVFIENKLLLKTKADSSPQALLNLENYRAVLRKRKQF